MILELESVFNVDGASFPFGYELSLSSLSVGGICPIKQPVKVKGEVKNNTGIVTLTAGVSFIYTSPCDRCAEDVARNYHFDFTHNLIATLENGDNDDFIQVNDMRLDLDELITEDINLSLPVKFLCSDDCKGICPQCGTNLNKSACNCKKPMDPRLEGLLQFLE